VVQVDISVGDRVKSLDEDERPVWGVVQKVLQNGSLIVRVQGLDEFWHPDVVVRVVR